MKNSQMHAMLLRRGGLKLVKELEARSRIIERNEPVYSTQEACPINLDKLKNKGTIAASSAISAQNSFREDHGSRRTKFFTAIGEVGSFQKIRARVMREF